MSKQIIIIAPHPDDETLGCGGTILRHLDQGDQVHWLIVTEANVNNGFSKKQEEEKKMMIKTVESMYNFTSVVSLGLPPAKLERLALSEIIASLSSLFKMIEPEVVYLSYPGDVHTDHRVVFDATAACTKWFRHPNAKRIMVYETLSETEFGINPDNNSFKPNVFVDITKYLEKKIEILKVYHTELKDFPFPRSEQGVRALASLRGVMSGVNAAESFMLLKEII